jgi:protein-tyrosine phosphatase
MLTQITKQIWLGDMDDVLDAFKKGITTILNVAKEISDPYLVDVKLIKVGLVDDAVPQTMLVNIAVDALNRLIVSGEVVLVHCALGVSRSPYIVARYFATKNRVSIARSYIELKTKYALADEETPLRCNS